MPINVEIITNSSLGVSLLSTIAAHIDPRLGHSLADYIADRIARQKSSRLVRALRLNQWVVMGEKTAAQDLESAVRRTLRYSARSVFDLYRYIHDTRAIERMVTLERGIAELISRAEFSERGVLIVGLHLSNFDLMVRWFCGQDFHPLVLTIPDPRGGRRVEYEMRQQMGVNIVPVTVAGLRKAIQHLGRGGTVLTGIDRPVPRPRLQPCFFGRPASLPVHHIYLATRARVPIVVAATTLEDDGRYHVRVSDGLEMGTDHGGDEQMLRDAESVLRVAEGFIARAPQQWSVPLAVWPLAANLIPQ
jgi:lauroyl/myristoyl acyltransferase